jgi:threonine dehydrogenase-like Zn-dependent dehydrogenase
MKAFVYHGPGRRTLEDKPKSTVKEPTDAVVKITCTTICGTDLYKALLKIHNDFPQWLQQRIAFLDHASVACAIKKGSQS